MRKLTSKADLSTLPLVKEVIDEKRQLTAYVRRMSLAETIVYENCVREARDEATAYLVRQTLCDEAGNRVLEDTVDDLEFVRRLDGPLCAALVEAALKLNNLSEKDLDELTESFTETRAN